MYSLVYLAPQLVRKGDINYLVADYLSEITMSLLVAAKRKSPVREMNSIVCSQYYKAVIVTLPIL